MSEGANPRVIIDGRALVGNRTGIGVHTAEIARRLPLAPSPLIATHAGIEDKSALEICRFHVRPRPWGVLWQQLDLSDVGELDHSEVLWSPHGTLPLRLRIPAVVSIHDLSSINMPGAHRLKTVLSFNLFIGPSLRRAAAVAAVSRRTADELIRGFALDSRKITIVPNGVDAFFSPRTSADPNPLPGPAGGDPYILYVGTFEPRKGLADLLEAWNALPPRRPKLVLCGDRGWGVDEELFERKGQEGIIRLSFVDRSTLRELYRNALVFVYPSRYEGFGLPPLEAMACGAPVLSTATGAIDEYLGEAGVIVRPGDRTALTRQLRRLTESEHLRTELREAGRRRAEEYRWERSAAVMAQLLEQAARG